MAGAGLSESINDISDIHSGQSVPDTGEPFTGRRLLDGVIAEKQVILGQEPPRLSRWQHMTPNGIHHYQSGAAI
jgi:hypothetical protein